MGQSLRSWEEGHFRKSSSGVNHREMARLLEGEIPRLRRYASVLARDPSLAEDLVQDCLVRAISRFHTWEPGTNLRAWLMKILRNVFFSELRRVKTRRAVENTIVDYNDDECAAANAWAQEREADLAAVQRAFNGLSDEHREILLLVGLDQLAYKEAASVLGLPIGTVRSRVSRARAAMRKCILRCSRADASGLPATLRDSAGRPPRPSW
jgi:RNA polymerase sigma-70 factor (ECF subfamily)